MLKFDEPAHPWIQHRLQHKPAQTSDEHVGFNGRLALFVTRSVGTMWCAYVFTGIAAGSLVGVFTGNAFLALLFGSISSYVLQLILLPVIIVGQNVQSTTADKRAVQTYNDAEAILHECLRLQSHLEHQDQVLNTLMSRERGARAG